MIGTAAVLAGLAVRPDEPAWSAAAVEAGAASLRRTAAPDGSGRSLADGPTVEGLMYTTYEAANVALLQATVAANRLDPGVTGPLDGALPGLHALADWNERCGRVADPAVEDGWDLYPWVDRTTALAAMASSPHAGAHLLALIDGLQARSQLMRARPRAVWAGPTASPSSLLSQVSPGGAVAPPAQALVSGGAPDARRYGCATHGDTYALLTGIPNDVPHAHADVGNVVVKQGEKTVLDDLGQRTYGFTGGPVWRVGTKAHSTVGVLQDDGSVRQTRAGSGAVSVEGDDLRDDLGHGAARGLRLGPPGRRRRRDRAGPRHPDEPPGTTRCRCRRRSCSLPHRRRSPGSRTARCASRWPTAASGSSSRHRGPPSPTPTPRRPRRTSTPRTSPGRPPRTPSSWSAPTWSGRST